MMTVRTALTDREIVALLRETAARGKRFIAEKGREPLEDELWDKREVLEPGRVRTFLRIIGFDDVEIERPQNDPPDCSVKLLGQRIGIEEATLVSAEAHKATRSGKPSYGIWDVPRLVSELTKIMRDKDQKQFGGGYDKKVLLIVVDEDEIAIGPNLGATLIAEASFPPLRQIDEVYLMLPYCPAMKREPLYRLSPDQIEFE